MWAPRTTAKESGFWRTPNANVIEAKSTVVKLTGRKRSDPQVGLADQVAHAQRAKMWQTPVAADAASRPAGLWNSQGEPKLSAQALQQPTGKWATPSASDATRGGTITEKMTGQSLVQMVNTPSKWPTPTVCGNYNRKGVSPTSGDGLATAVKMYPTATATAYKGWSPNHNRAETNDRLDYTIERQGFAPGQQTPPMRLNPDWVEWLMGWPIGQTALKPLETDKYREWQQQHSIF